MRPGAPFTSPQAPPEFWVDGSAAPQGDGSAASPWRTLAQLPTDGTGWVAHLKTGVYPGPLRLPSGTKLLGQGRPVLTLDGPGVVVTVEGATLEAVWITGGEVGLSTRGSAHLKDVGFSSQRVAALEVAQGELAATGLVFEKPLGHPDALVVRAGTRLRLDGVRVEGPFRRGLDAVDADLEVRGLTTLGANEAVHLVGGKARLDHVKSSSGRGPGLFAARVDLTLSDFEVVGHEYGAQMSNSQLAVDHFSSTGAQRAGFATVNSTGRLSQLTVSRFGDFGALQLLGSTLDVRDAVLSDGESAGIVVRKGTARLERVSISKVRAAGEEGGDGLMLRDAVVVATALSVGEVPGMGLFAGAAARVQVTDFRCTNCLMGALYAEQAAQVTATGVVLEGRCQSAVVVPDAASVEVSGLRLTNEATAPVWADCGEGAVVRLKGPRPPGGLRLPRCVEWVD